MGFEDDDEPFQESDLQQDIDELRDKIEEVEGKLQVLEHKVNEAGSGVGCLPIVGPVGLGSALAIVISWQQYRSILWAIIHGLLSWGYVAYYWWMTQ